MKIQDNSDKYSSYTHKQHIENLKGLAHSTELAKQLGTGMGGVDQMMLVAVNAASAAGLSDDEIARYSGHSLDDVRSRSIGEPEDIKVSAQIKAKKLLTKIDTQYTGSFNVNEVPEVGYLVTQDVRGGNSVIVGNDGGVLFFTSSVSPEDATQAYKDGKRTPEDQFNSAN